MRRTFPFQDLASTEFEDLVATICQKILGTGVIVFATGKDGGRDAAFKGTAERFPSSASPLGGKFIIQAKHTANPAASCSDAEFGRLLKAEHGKITALVACDELDHYLVFTNRKKPATTAIAKEAELRGLGLTTAHLLGIEQLRSWLTQHADIWRNLGFDRFDRSFRIQTSDITAIVTAFYEATIAAGYVGVTGADFSYLPKPQKNKLNKLSENYFNEIRVRSLPYFKAIEDFLKNPRNIEYKEMYDDTVDEIRRKLISAAMPFESFDEALTHIIDTVTSTNPSLVGRRRFAAIFMHYMYYTCDIGQHADTV